MQRSDRISTISEKMPERALATTQLTPLYLSETEPLLPLVLIP